MSPKAKRQFLAIIIALLGSLAAPEVGAQIKVGYDDQPAKKEPKATMRFVERMPEFSSNLSEFLSANLRYPDSARARNQEGRAAVEFVVGESGLVRDIRITKSSGFELLDEEALRLVRLMQLTPYWKPGTQEGVAVPVIFTLPITFKLED
jgi:protein TonB